MITYHDLPLHARINVKGIIRTKTWQKTMLHNLKDDTDLVLLNALWSLSNYVFAVNQLLIKFGTKNQTT